MWSMCVDSRRFHPAHDVRFAIDDVAIDAGNEVSMQRFRPIAFTMKDCGQQGCQIFRDTIYQN
jgi:hypothetical protein